MQSTSDHKLSPEAARVFALAGNAILTLQSARTGNHFTYKVVAPDEEKQARRGYTPEPVWFVKLLTSGSADEGEFTYLGMIKNQGASGFGFFLTRASKARPESPCVKAFEYFFNYRGSKDLVIRHECRCGRCGRTLTDPVSIDSGYGPECRSILGIDTLQVDEAAIEAAAARLEEADRASGGLASEYV